MPQKSPNPRIHLTEEGGITSIEGFDVTVEAVIGTVKFGSGNEHPVRAAMAIITDHYIDSERDAVYRFPAEDIGNVVVSISLEKPEEPDGGPTQKN